MRKHLIILIMAFCMLFTACGADGSSDSLTKPDDIVFLDMSAKLLSGEEYSFRDKIQENKICIINIWATFCGPCIEEMPELNEISEEYAGTVGVIGICADCSDAVGNVDDDLVKTAKKIAFDDLSVSYPIVVPSKGMQESFLSEVTAVPLTYIVDDSGTVLESFYGRRDKEEFLEIVKKYASLD